MAGLAPGHSFMCDAFLSELSRLSGWHYFSTLEIRREEGAMV